MRPVEFFPLPFLIGIGILAVLLIRLWRTHHHLAYLFCFSAFWLYLMSVVNATLFPILLPSTRQPAAHILSGVNLTPLDFGGLFFLHPNVIRRELVGNIVLTVPFGFGVNFLARCRGRAIPFLGIAAGLIIETAQLGVSLGIGGSYRGVDINDVLLNAAGVVIGYGLFRLFTPLYRAASDRLGIPHRGLPGYIYQVAQVESRNLSTNGANFPVNGAH